MPNWCYNSLDVIGPAEHLDKFIADFYGAKPYREQRFDDKGNEYYVDVVTEPQFAFSNIIAPHESILDEYYGKQQHTSLQESMLFQTNHWYDWNIRHWGTKWDITSSETEHERYSETGATWSFPTAWAPPIEFVSACSERYPELTFSIDFEEEGMGFAGEETYKHGKRTKLVEYDINHDYRMEKYHECYQCMYLADDYNVEQELADAVVLCEMSDEEIQAYVGTHKATV